ncbi:MAG: hypothetical protein JWR19_637 [Pedosphaera sp.]|nr:hypothetical protein [Pedosphaera sp.]
MSFEAFVQCFKEGEFTAVPCQQVRDAFGSFLTEGGAFDWQLYYDEQNNCDVMLKLHDADKSLLQGFTVLRPCGDERFWDALAAILQLGNLVLYFPSDCPPLMGDVSVAQHLPSGMIEAMGQPRCVTKGREILQQLRAA